MTIKRLSPPPKPPAPTRRKVVSRRVATNTENEPLVSADEKRRLILAHAAMRRPQDPLQMMSAWAGIAIALLVVMTGWWWSSGSIIVNSVAKIGPEVQTALKDVPPIMESSKQELGTADFTQALKQATDKLRVMDVQAETRQRALDELAAMVSSSTVTSTRQDLFLHTSTTPSLNP